KGSREVFSVVEKMAEQGMTIVMAEHNMERIAEYADKVILLHDGKCIDFAAPEKVFSRDDIVDYGIEPPVVTRVAKRLKVKNKNTGYYPVKENQLSKEDLVNDHVRYTYE
ncbi:MAG TPA: hypothetical protein VK142_04330, partial [Bacillota bacterium]|nr:hypothetical protein [Bacillota bacterium]